MGSHPGVFSSLVQLPPPPRRCGRLPRCPWPVQQQQCRSAAANESSSESGAREVQQQKCSCERAGCCLQAETAARGCTHYPTPARASAARRQRTARHLHGVVAIVSAPECCGTAHLPGGHGRGRPTVHRTGRAVGTAASLGHRPPTTPWRRTPRRLDGASGRVVPKRHGGGARRSATAPKPAPTPTRRGSGSVYMRSPGPAEPRRRCGAPRPAHRPVSIDIVD